VPTVERKRSPQELVESVNRKHNILFGTSLVGLNCDEIDTSKMDVADFMNYLKPSSRIQLPLRRASPER
jgi:hypothetical protein